MEQANRQPKQNRTAHTKRTAGSGSAGQTNRRKSLRKGGRKAARRSGTKRRNTAEKGKIPPWASREKAAKKPVPSAQSRQAGQTVPKNSPRTRSACRKNAGAPGTKSTTTAAGGTRTAAPADGAARRAQKNPSEQAKRAFALLPARRGHVNRGRQKIASLFLAGTAFFCFALRTMPRAALHKRGRRPL